MKSIQVISGLASVTASLMVGTAFAASQYDELQAVPMAAPGKAAANLVDRNGNGLSDGLEAHLGAMRGGDKVDVVVRSPVSAMPTAPPAPSAPSSLFKNSPLSTASPPR